MTDKKKTRYWRFEWQSLHTVIVAGKTKEEAVKNFDKGKYKYENEDVDRDSGFIEVDKNGDEI